MLEQKFSLGEVDVKGRVVVVLGKMLNQRRSTTMEK